MRILIAGSDGYLGWFLAQHLAAHGRHRVAQRLSSGGMSTSPLIRAIRVDSIIFIGGRRPRWDSEEASATLKATRRASG